jgi:hypothetical protein
MAVEILILSGVRQGEQVVLDATSFRAGTSPDCAVYFDPRADASTANRSASFRLMEDGWYIVHTTGAILVNHKAVAGPTRLRSGDVVRMSERGPDFSFGILAGAAPDRTKSPGQAIKSPAASGPLPGLSPGVALPVGSPATVGSNGPIASVASFPEQPISERQEDSTLYSGAISDTVPLPITTATQAMTSVSVKQNTIVAATKERLILWVASGLAICVVLAILMRPIIIVPSTASTTSTPSTASTPSTPPAPPYNPPPLVPVNPPKSTPDKLYLPTTEELITAQIKDAVFLIQVETAGRFWPFATCSAIGKNTLLTRAWVACKISEWRNDSQKDFKIWITNPASGVKMAVKDIYINAILTTLADNPDGWKYCDLALLTVAEDLPKIIPLASVEEVAKLKEGSPIFCFGFTHEGEKVTEFDSFQPQLMRSKIYVITAHPNLPSHPRLLQIKEKILKNTFGSPVVNDRGKIVAVYGDVMQPQSNGENTLGGIHYATVLDPVFVNLGLNCEYGKIWISPDSYQIVSKTKEER